jgi:hypothetical protein
MARHGVAVTHLAVERHDRRVTVQTGTGLRLLQAPRRLLIGQHVGVTAPVPVVDGERVSQEHALEPGIAFDLLLRQRLAAAVSAEARAGGECGALITVVLARPVDTPRRWIGVVFSHFHQPHERPPRFALSLEYVDQQRRGGDGQHDREQQQCDESAPSSARSRPHGTIPSVSARVSGPPSPAVGP